MSHRTTKAELLDQINQMHVERERVDAENVSLRQDLTKEATETQDLWARMERVNESASATIRSYEIRLHRAYTRFAFVWLVMGVAGGVLGSALLTLL